MPHHPGAPVRVEMTKWGDAPHWRFTGTYLGADEHGDWVGFPARTHNARPGFEFDSEVDSVTLVPRDGWFLATFHQPGIWCDLYVDISSPPVWDGDVLRAVDLDLDVIRLTDPSGEVFVDDEDEFVTHQVALGYPAEVVSNARQSCDHVLAAVLAGEAPYDGSHRRWLELVPSLK